MLEKIGEKGYPKLFLGGLVTIGAGALIAAVFPKVRQVALSFFRSKNIQNTTEKKVLLISSKLPIATMGIRQTFQKQHFCRKVEPHKDAFLISYVWNLLEFLYQERKKNLEEILNNLLEDPALSPGKKQDIQNVKSKLDENLLSNIAIAVKDLLPTDLHKIYPLTGGGRQGTSPLEGNCLFSLLQKVELDEVLSGAQKKTLYATFEQASLCPSEIRRNLYFCDGNFMKAFIQELKSIIVLVAKTELADRAGERFLSKALLYKRSLEMVKEEIASILKTEEGQRSQEEQDLLLDLQRLLLKYPDEYSLQSFNLMLEDVSNGSFPCSDEWVTLLYHKLKTRIYLLSKGDLKESYFWMEKKVQEGLQNVGFSLITSERGWHNPSVFVLENDSSV